MVGGGDHSTGMFAMEFAQPDYDWDDGAYQIKTTSSSHLKRASSLLITMLSVLALVLPLQVAVSTSLRYILFTYNMN